MKYILLFSLFLTSACASTQKTTSIESVIKTQKDLPKEDATCFIDGQVFQEKNLQRISDHGKEKYILEATDGKKMGLPMDSCILQSQESSAIKVSDSQAEKKHAVKCILGPVSFVSDNLTYVADEGGYFRLRGENGMEWSLPRVNCSIYNMKGL